MEKVTHLKRIDNFALFLAEQGIITSIGINNKGRIAPSL